MVESPAHQCEISLPDFQSEMQQCSRSENSSGADLPGTIIGQAKRAGKDRSEARTKNDGTGTSLPVALISGERDVRILRFSLASLPLLPCSAALHPTAEYISANRSAPLGPRQVLPKSDNALDDAIGEVSSFNPEPLSSALPEEQTVNPAAGQGNLAFAARLFSTASATQAGFGGMQTPPADVTNRPLASSPSALQKCLAVNPQAVEASHQAGDEPTKGLPEQFTKLDVLAPFVRAAQESNPNSKAHVLAVAPQPSIEANIEAAQAPPSSSHDIRVRVPDNQGGAMDVRFLDLGGEVRVSVRTPDDGLAQTLRGNLAELAHRLSVGGIQTELWHTDSGSSASHSSSQHSGDSDSNSNQSRHGTGQRGRRNSQQQSKQDQPPWLKEFEFSTRAVQSQ